MDIKNLFKSVLSKFKKDNAESAGQKLDEGKNINLNMRSERYTYGDADDSGYLGNAKSEAYRGTKDSNWKPTTELEKQTLSPKGYYRTGERAEQKDSRLSSIYSRELDKIKTEKNHKRVTKTDKLEAENRANKEFDQEYNEKQISIPSTAIKNIKYNPKSEALLVKFQGSNKEYFYPAVPLELVQALLKAPSKGEFFLTNIHDQYSIYGKNHSPKSKSQQNYLKKYQKAYNKANKNKW